MHVDVCVSSRCDSTAAHALRQVRSTGKREDSLCLFLQRCPLRINLRTRGRARTLPRVLSGFIASPSGALDRRWRYAGSRVSYSLKSFERDRGVRNFVRITDVLIGQALSFRFWDAGVNEKIFYIQEITYRLYYVKIKILNFSALQRVSIENRPLWTVVAYIRQPADDRFSRAYIHICTFAYEKLLFQDVYICLLQVKGLINILLNL